MRRKGLRVIAAVAAFVSGLALIWVPEVSAQTGYPPGVCTPVTSAQDAGAHNIGDVFTVRMVPVCLFDAGAIVGISVNGQGIGTKAADAGGGVSLQVRVVSATQLEIDDPVTVAGQCGANNIVATGPSSAARAQVTHTANFTVLCPGAQPASAVRGRVAFTGANLLRWGAIALVLIAAGAFFVYADRRRARARD